MINDKHKLTLLLLIAVIVIPSYLAVSTLSYNDQKATQERYCKNVANGTWPAYRAHTQRLCKGYKKHAVQN